MKLLGIDCETTGLHSESQLLTLYMNVVDSNSFTVIDSINLLLKPDPVEGRVIWSVQTEAMQVNKINLTTHEKKAITYKAAKPLVYNWLSQYNHLTPFGNCVSGDIEKITKYIISEGSWHSFVDRRVIELTSIGKTLQLLGKIPETQSLSLSNISKFLGMEPDAKKLHTAQYDVDLGLWVLEKYTEMMK